MRFPNKTMVAYLRQLYPSGTRVELIRMEDVQAPPVGTMGTVCGVDDRGGLRVGGGGGAGLDVVWGVGGWGKGGGVDEA